MCWGYFGDWVSTITSLNKSANIVCELQSLDTLDNGKPFKDAFSDVGNAIRIARYFAGLVDKVVGQTIPAGKSELVVLLCILFATFYF